MIAYDARTVAALRARHGPERTAAIITGNDPATNADVARWQALGGEAYAPPPPQPEKPVKRRRGRPPRVPDADTIKRWSKMATLYTYGLGTAEIAERFGMTQDGVAKVLAEQGVRLRRAFK